VPVTSAQPVLGKDHEQGDGSDLLRLRSTSLPTQKEAFCTYYEENPPPGLFEASFSMPLPKDFIPARLREGFSWSPRKNSP